MAIKKILTKNNPILRKKSEAIQEFSDKISELAKDMIETMNSRNGVGLAAPQIGYSVRLITVAYKNGALILTNPKIIRKSLRKNIGEEGCLCTPGVFGLVKRYNAVVVTALNSKNQKIKFKAKGFFARVIQHEIDHLDGILFIDKVIKYTKGNE